MNLNLKYILLVLFAFTINAQAQKIEYQFQYLTPGDGLVDGTINAFAQDASGVMWFGTFDGLISYDGYRMKSYKPMVGDLNSLLARQVTDLFMDSRNNLWITTAYGICRYNRVLDNFDRFVIPEYPFYRISGITFFDLENILVLHSPAGKFYYPLDKEDPDFSFKPLVYHDRSTDHFNNIPVAGQLIDDRIVLLDYSGDSTVFDFITLVRKGEEVTFKISNQVETGGHISDLLFSPPGNLFAIADQEIKLVITEDFHKQSEKSLLNIPGINGALLASDQSIWISLHSGGTARYDLHNGKFTRISHDPNIPGSLLGDRVVSMFEDFSGNLWLGHLGDGVSIYNLRKKAFHNITFDPLDENSLSHGTVLCFEETKDGMLAGTDGGGLNMILRQEQTDQPFVEKVVFPDHFQYPAYVINDYDIWTIAKENENEFWLGTNFGLIKMTMPGERWYFRQYNTYEETGIIRKIFIDEHENMWLGCYKGLFLWPASKRKEEDSQFFSYNQEINADFRYMAKGRMEGDVITDILLDTEDRFWVASQNGGLYLLDTEYVNLNLSGKLKPELNFIQYAAANNLPGSLNNNEINSLIEFFDGNIWCCTQGGGINIFNPQLETFTYITVENGLPGNDVFGILPDDYGHLWASTNRGLCRMNMLNPKEDMVNFSPSDGIQGHIFMVNAFFKNRMGTMYFGGRTGLTYFNPDEIKQNSTPPRFRFTDLKIHNKQVFVRDTIGNRVILPKALNELSSITLSHKEYNLSIGIASIHFEDPGNNKISYMLEGYDMDWVNVKSEERYINYSNLSHGTYTLRVRAFNSDNVRTAEERLLSIDITPPWWKMWYTILAEILILLSIFGIIGYLLLHRASLQHTLQLEKMENKNIERINESKLKFFTDISHELKTPLSLVIAPLEDLTDDKNSYDETYFRKQSGLILRNAKLLKRLIDQIIDFRKVNAGKLSLVPERQDIGRFTMDIIQHFEIYKTDITCRLIHNIPEEPLLVWFDTKKMEKVIYNLISNAFKHASQNGIIVIALEAARQSTDHSRHPVEGVNLSVYNEGKTIPEDLIDKIFERFYQTDNLADGSGIGLALTKSLVELHHGSIKVESVEGDGTTFTVFLPNERDKDKKDSSPDKESAQAAKDETTTARTLEVASMDEYAENKDLKVLLIEDNIELRDFLRTILQRYYDYHEANDGDVGLKMAEEIIPDLVISDVIMPGKDGVEVCKAIKENIRTCHIPVVLLTARSAPEHMVDGYEAGADAYIAKPFEIKVLLTQISRLIKNRSLIRDKFREQNFMIDRPTNLASRDEIFLKTLNEEIRNNISDPEFNVTQLSKILDLSQTQIYRKIKALTGSNSVEYIRIVKLSKAVELLKTRKYSVKEVCYKSGFNDPSYFVRCFKSHYQMTPSEFMYINETGKPDPDRSQQSTRVTKI